jgi:hypothetical protein
VGEVPEVVEEAMLPGELYDQGDPRSLYNIVPQWLRDAMDTVDPEVLLRSEHELKKASRADARLNRIRMAFWSEYEEAQAMVRNIDMLQVSRATCISLSFIKQCVTRDQYCVAFLLTQPVEYSVFLEEALAAGLGQLREILDAPMYNEEGKLMCSIANLKLKAVAFIDLRVHGGIVEKRLQISENRNVSEHVFTSRSDRTKTARMLSGNSSQGQLEMLNQQIAELEQKKEFKEARAMLPEPAVDTMEDLRGNVSPERTRAVDKLLGDRSRGGRKVGQDFMSSKREKCRKTI